MDELTPEQKKQLQTWAEQRDSILGEITTHRREEEKLVKHNKDLSESNTELETTIQMNRGRILELDKQEKVRAKFISLEVYELEKKKTRLESIVSGLEKNISTLTARHEDITSNIKTLIETHDRVYARTSVLDQVVDRVTRVNGQSINEVNIMISGLKDSVSDMSTSLVELNDGIFKKANDLNVIVTKALDDTSKNTQAVSGLIKDMQDKLK